MIDPCPYFLRPMVYENYAEEVEERANELIDGGEWDVWEAVLYESGEMSREEIYTLAEREACNQIYNELIDVDFQGDE